MMQGNGEVVASNDDTGSNVVASNEDTDGKVVTNNEDTDGNVVTSNEDTDCKVVTSNEDTDGKVVASNEDTDSKVVTSNEDTNGKVVTSNEDTATDSKVVTSNEDTDSKVVTSNEDTDSKDVTSNEDTDSKVVTSNEDTASKVVTSNADTDGKVVTSNQDTDSKVVTSNEDTDGKVVTSNADTDGKVVTSNEYTDSKVVISNEDTDGKVVTSNADTDSKVVTSNEDTDSNIVISNAYTDSKVVVRNGDSDSKAESPKLTKKERLKAEHLSEKERLKAERRKDLCLVILVVMVKFGDAVEIYLPGVITQQTSCELNVSGTEEALLGIIMYLSQAVSTILAQTISRYISQRTVVMVSLYISIVATIMCAVVHNYITLLLSRMFVGFCIGLNNSNINVLFNQAVSNRKTADWGLYLVNFGFAFGSGWVSILGYIFLKMLGWRNFVLLVSIPWFIPPILMFHFYLTPKFLQTAKEENEKAARDSGTATTLPDPDDIPSAVEIWREPTTRNRLVKVGGLNFLLCLHGCGTILLLPSLFRAANVADISDDDRCAGVIGGTQFLIMAAISGGINSLAKLPALYLPRWIKFRVLMTSLGSLITLSFAVMMVWDFTHPSPNMWVIVTTISIITFAWSIMLNEAICCIHDHDIFRPAIEAHTSAVIWGLVALGITAGNALASFMDPVTAVQANFGISFIEIILILLTHERVSNKEKHAAKLAAKPARAEFKAVNGGEAVICNPIATDVDIER